MQENQLQRALSSFLETSGLDQLATILACAWGSGKISYTQIQEIIFTDFEDSLLLAIQQRLLIPARSIKGTLDWDDSVLLLEPGEIYRMPNVIRCLIEDSCQNGEWKPWDAIARVFRNIGDPDWEIMPAVVEKMAGKAEYNIINAYDIIEAFTDFGLADRVDPMIAELKGTGIMSPKLAVIDQGLRIGAPVYELNPSVAISVVPPTETGRFHPKSPYVTP
jgi:hypothetical protein